MLHEIAHFKRYTNPYLDLDIKTRDIGLLSVDEYCDTVINEELFADRWASLMYYMIYKKQFPIKLTQKLGDKESNTSFFKYFFFGLRFNILYASSKEILLEDEL